MKSIGGRLGRWEKKWGNLQDWIRRKMKRYTFFILVGTEQLTFNNNSTQRWYVGKTKTMKSLGIFILCCLFLKSLEEKENCYFKGILSQMHKNRQGSLKVKINLLLRKPQAWDVMTHHDLPSQELTFRSARVVIFSHWACRVCVVLFLFITWCVIEILSQSEPERTLTGT